MKPLVEVFWTDHAFSPDGNGLVKQRSVGFLVKEKKRFIVIAQSCDENGKYMDRLTVGRDMLRKVKRLR
ncbi:MAG TPA: hypothetical protein VFY54_05140 [Rubrobacter sp.]|nr:hypothetical protein [Rubrobacter sp.]